MTIAQQLARFSSGLEYPTLPARVKARALALLADWLANAAAGRASPLGRALYGLVPTQPLAGPPLAGSLRSAEPLLAALINAGAGHSLEFDDSDRAGLYHPGTPVIGAGWSSAASPGVGGADLLAGIVAGYEVSMRLARAVNPGHYALWHTTGTVGVLGAAAAAARTLGLDQEVTAWALGLAGTQASGLWEVLPTAPLAKNLHPAKAAQAGLLAARLAQAGIPGPVSILEGERGLFKAMVPQAVSPEACLAGLGGRWLILETTLKAYPVCGHTMTPIEAALDLGGRFSVPDLEGVEVRADPVSIRVAGQLDPATESQAKFSIPYCVALALVRGRVSQADFSARSLADPEVRRVMGLLQLVPDQEMAGKEGQRPARIILRLKNGRVLRSTAYFRKGDPENPLTDEDRKAKFMDLTVPVWGGKTSHRIWEALSDLEGCDLVSDWWQGLPRPEPQQT